MVSKEFLKKIDALFSAYLGIQPGITLNSVELVSGNILVMTTESNKRHRYLNGWDTFVSIDFKETNSIDREKLGVAVGKAIAKNLVVSFEETTIQQDNIYQDES